MIAQTPTGDAKPSQPKSRWRNFVGQALLVVGSLCFAFLLVEIVMRFADLGSDQFLQPDKVLGVRFIPGKHGLSQEACYSTPVSVNSAGWRGREVPIAKPPGVYRVLVLGDSFMAGMQVGDNEVFASVLEAELATRIRDRRVEVINFGVPSYGTDQEYLSLREFGLAYKPDLVVLAFYGQNDVSDNYSVLISAKSVYPKPFFDVRNGELVERPFTGWMPPPIRIARRLAAHSRLYIWVRDTAIKSPWALRLLYRMGIVGIVPQDDRPGDDVSDVAEWRWPARWKRQIGVYEHGDQWPPREHAWEITERLIGETRNLAEAHGASFVLLELSSPISVMPPPMISRLVAGHDAAIVEQDKPSNHLAEIATRHRIDMASLIPEFRRRIGDSETEFAKYYLRCDGHWTVAGNRLAAEIAGASIAQRIERKSP